MELTPGNSALRTLTIQEGRFALTAESVPACLLEVNQLLRRGEVDQARQRLKEGLPGIEDDLVCAPGRTDLMFILAKLLADCGQPDQAETWFHRVARRDPHPQVLDQLSRLCFRDQTRWSEGAEFSRMAWEAMPEDVGLTVHWAWSLVRTGRIDHGLRVLQGLAAATPDSSDAFTTSLWFQHYGEHSLQQIAEGYRQWARRFAPVDRAQRAHANDPDPDRRLRIGYISPDFQRRAAASAIEVVLDGHDRQQVEVFAYGNVAYPDQVTRRFISKVDRYQSIYGQGAQTVADQIRRDQVDILVEIGGHVTENRLDVLALKPAPVQGDFGGISTTGMPQVDFRLADAIIDPADVLTDYAEQSIYVPGGLTCFCPPSQSPPVGPLPALRQGYVTFGSVNNNPKVNSGTVALWARVLRQTPTSRMILKLDGGVDAGIQALYRHQFESHGVDGGRVRIVGQQPYLEYLGLFHRIDLLLDACPYNGCITTQEGLWMGVPIVTLAGQTPVSRMGLAILTRLGLEVFSATSEDEYVAKATAAASQQAELAQIRQSLRTLMLASPLCDPGRLARGLDQAYRSAWRAWCQRQGSDGGTAACKGPHQALVEKEQAVS